MGTQRKTEETVMVPVTFSCYSGDDQQTVTERAYAYADLLRAHLKTDAGIQLGLTSQQARGCYVADSQLLETDNADDAASGRYAELTLLITTKARLY